MLHIAEKALEAGNTHDSTTLLTFPNRFVRNTFLCGRFCSPTDHASKYNYGRPITAIAIMFDFVNPVLTLRRLIDRGSELGTDKAENAGHAII